MLSIKMTTKNILLQLFVFMLINACGGRYMNTESWAMLTRRSLGPTCVDIPANMSLCYGIEYTQMRMPNFLDHETVDEVIQQSSAWTTLTSINCHADTQLFLCSVFAPVCVSIERMIPPCRDLCLAVKGGCESRMNQYGFAWPEMLDCHRWPDDTDMCVRGRDAYVDKPTQTQPQQPVPTSATTSTAIRTTLKPTTAISQLPSCPMCAQVGTYENILDHYCRSTYVIKAKVDDVKSTQLTIGRGLELKMDGGRGRYLTDNHRPQGQGQQQQQQKQNNRQQRYRNLNVQLSNKGDSCSCPTVEFDPAHPNRKYLIMASRNVHTGQFVGNMLLPFTKQKNFKKAVRMFGKIDCSQLGQLIRERARRRLLQHQQRETDYFGRVTTISQREPWY